MTVLLEVMRYTVQNGLEHNVLYAQAMGNHTNCKFTFQYLCYYSVLYFNILWGPSIQMAHM